MAYASLLASPPKHPYMLAWERDLDIDLESEYSRLQIAYKGILNVSLIEASVKVLTRWYLVPTHLAKMYLSSSADCFRGCSLRGTMLHLWWECPRIKGFPEHGFLDM